MVMYDQNVTHGTQLMLASENHEPQGQYRHDHALLKNKQRQGRANKMAWYILTIRPSLGFRYVYIFIYMTL